MNDRERVPRKTQCLWLGSANRISPIKKPSQTGLGEEASTLGRRAAYNRLRARRPRLQPFYARSRSSKRINASNIAAALYATA